MSAQFIDEDKVRGQMSLRRLMIRLWPWIWQDKRGVISVFFLVIAYTILGRTLPFLFGYAIDEGIRKNAIDVVYWVAGLFLACEITRVSFGFLQSYLMEKIGNRVLFQMRERLIDHVQHLPIRYFDKNPAGRILTRVTNDVLSLGDLFNQGFTALFVSGLELIAIAAAMFMLSFKLAAFTLIITPAALYFSIKLSERCRFFFAETKKKMAQMNAFTAESLNGMKVLQLFHQTLNRQQKFSRLSDEYRGLQMQTVKQYAMLWPVLGFFNVATVASALFFAAYFRESQGLTIGEISTFILLVQSFYSPIRTILERYTQFQNSLAGADRMFTLLAEPRENLEGSEITRSKGAIEISGLSFKYAPEADYALRAMNLSIRSGESVALVGRTGSGKSTTAGLLQRFYEYSEGEIFLDGVELRKYKLAELRQRIGVVQQDPFIFRGTLFTNITLHDPSISLERAREALIRASGEKLLLRHAEGLQARVEERGGNLSVGEKQMIAFARVLAFDPDILILDEATANIDSESEALIQKATREAIRGRTSIIIAHRLSTVVDCDKIVVLDKGSVMEVGSHAELMERDGMYSRYYRAALEQNVTVRPV
jgi:ATP-binding cassette, subfamily B, multidrug efflux pump